MLVQKKIESLVRYSNKFMVIYERVNNRKIIFDHVSITWHDGAFFLLLFKC